MTTFTPESIREISRILGVEAAYVAHDQGGEYFFEIENEQTRQSLTLTLHNNVTLGEDGEIGTLVVVQTLFGYFELHDCRGFVVFEPDEIIFASGTAERFSGLVVGRQCTCSTFSNMRRSNLSADFTELDPRLLMSAMQMSLAETVVES